MQNVSERRGFLRQASAIGLAAASGLVTQTAKSQESSSRPVVIGVMGLSRGRELARQFAAQPNVEVRYVCDADLQRVDACLAAMKQQNQSAGQGVQDFRRILDDDNVDALVCAAPNHWHAPATILACQAGKHVYVEKPCSHNPWEGEAMVQVARQLGKVVQLGTQRRSSPGTQLAVERLHSGTIGRVYLARAWYSSLRGSIGRGKPAAVPQSLDYALWQGPAPKRDYMDNVVHYNWHWRWHWGNGELGNNGVHSLDICRWGLDVTYPVRVTSSGGRYAFDDDQETPDTHTVAFEFPDEKAITWHGLSCNRHGDRFITFYGTDGSMELDEVGGFRIFDRNDKLQQEHDGGRDGGDTKHITNFLQAVRSGDPGQLNAPILEGHRSTLLCHLGNIAQRVGRVVSCDPNDGKIQGDADAQTLWKREYAPDWEPHV
jgi:predicted dehydrogenase